MISDNVYDGLLAFAAIAALFGLYLAGAANWLSGAVLGILLTMVVLKDRILHDHLHRRELKE